MSASGRKEFDVKHILRLRWKRFSHPSQTSASSCLPQDSFEHWGPSQTRQKSHGHERSVFRKKSGDVNGSLFSSPRNGRDGNCDNDQQRTTFYVEAVGEMSRMEFTREVKPFVQEVKEEEADSDCEETGEGCGQRLSVASWPLTPQTDMDSSNPEEFFQSVQHAEQTFRKMENYLKQQQLCDVILIAGNRKIPAHRLVLSAVSDYFAAMFKNDVCEAKQEEIKMEGIDPNALWDLVQFAYTGCLELKEETIENLLAAACLLQLSKENIMEVIRNQEFLLLSADEILKLLSCDDVNVPDEESIFHALLMWVKHDVQRCNDLSMLLAYIRLPLLPAQLLADLENNILFKDDLECQKLILEAMKYHLLPERRLLMQSPRTKPRKSTVGALYAVGGMDNNKGASTIETYDLRTNSWTQAGMMNGRRLQFGVAVIEENLYVIGGRDGLKTLNTVECYNLKSKNWTIVSPMSTHRHGLGVTLLEGPIYAVGGHDGWSYLNTVERWDPQSQQWTFVASMSTARSTAGVAALNGKLCAVGGRDGSSCLSSMECYDPHTNKWSMCSPMSKRRGGVGVAACDGFLYAVGGHDAPASSHCSRLSDCVERYDPKTDTWTIVAPLNLPRDAVGVCLLGDKLYAVGGYDGQTYLNTMESYDPETNEWTKMSSLNIGRAGACVIVIKQP
ncbi:Kelch-like protein 1 [Acipenser ruthenus]|uniref:Kelch-like protein 1 n=1 Tax=Acipenser ruthenus TaxID=7906 RepID=A0A662YNJ8_ACIRT|nr:Kelch-like protein 1 [Acipenser ruthenus]